jgi:hypothetical protein
MPDLNECKSLKNVLQGFKDVRFRILLTDKIRSPNITNEKRQQAQTLLTLIEAANVQVLETHYLTGQDMENRDLSWIIMCFVGKVVFLWGYAVGCAHALGLGPPWVTSPATANSLQPH